MVTMTIASLMHNGHAIYKSVAAQLNTPDKQSQHIYAVPRDIYVNITVSKE